MNRGHLASTSTRASANTSTTSRGHLTGVVLVQGLLPILVQLAKGTSLLPVLALLLILVQLVRGTSPRRRGRLASP